MAERPVGVLHAWLAAGGADAQFFLNDVVGMLRTKALRHDLAVEAAGPTSPYPDAAEHLFLAIGGQLVAGLADEVGLHRVQFVPPDGEEGRIRTAIVAVEFLKHGQQASTGRPGWPMVKTYNYVLRSCVRHATGQVSSLRDALRGEA